MVMGKNRKENQVKKKRDREREEKKERDREKKRGMVRGEIDRTQIQRQI